MHLTQRNALITQYQPLAFHHAGQVPGITVTEMEDLTSLLLIRLVRAVEEFQPGKGAALKTWLIQALRWETQEYFRNRGGMTRTAWEALADPDHRNHLGARMLADAECLEELEPWELDIPDPDADPFEAACQRMQAEAVRGRLAWLPRRERAVVRRVYFVGEHAAVIGRHLGIGESRVGQIKAKALTRLETCLTADIPPPGSPIVRRVEAFVAAEGLQITRRGLEGTVSRGLEIRPSQAKAALCWIRRRAGVAIRPYTPRAVELIRSGQIDATAWGAGAKLAQALGITTERAQTTMKWARRALSIPTPFPKAEVSMLERVRRHVDEQGIDLRQRGLPRQIGAALGFSATQTRTALTALRGARGICVQSCAEGTPPRGAADRGRAG